VRTSSSRTTKLSLQISDPVVESTRSHLSLNTYQLDGTGRQNACLLMATIIIRWTIGELVVSCLKCLHCFHCSLETMSWT